MMCPMGYICGIDEVGRGPIAGPVTAAAVILHEDFPVDLLDDSKKLSAKKRALLDVMIREQALAWGIGWVSPKSIDEMNILQASLLAMERAYGTMCRTFGIDDAQLLLIDGNTFPHMNHHMAAVIKGDGAVPEIMAAPSSRRRHGIAGWCGSQNAFRSGSSNGTKDTPQNDTRHYVSLMGSPRSIERLSGFFLDEIYRFLEFFDKVIQILFEDDHRLTFESVHGVLLALDDVDEQISEPVLFHIEK